MRLPEFLPRDVPDLRERVGGDNTYPTRRMTSFGKVQIESKEEMKARGLPSPDLAARYNATLLYALCTVLLWLGVATNLYRKRIFITVLEPRIVSHGRRPSVLMVSDGRAGLAEHDDFGAGHRPAGIDEAAGAPRGGESHK